MTHSIFSKGLFDKKRGTNFHMAASRLNTEIVIENYFSYFSTKTYVVSTQKNCLNEMVLFVIKTYQ